MGTFWVDISPHQDSLNTKELARGLLETLRLQLLKTRPNKKENLEGKVWKGKLRALHENMREKLER
jgi:hypothetical protein